MTKRERALQIINMVSDYLNEPGVIEPKDVAEATLDLEVAKAFLLADIGEQLERIKDDLPFVLAE